MSSFHKVEATEEKAKTMLAQGRRVFADDGLTGDVEIVSVNDDGTVTEKGTGHVFDPASFSFEELM